MDIRLEFFFVLIVALFFCFVLDSTTQKTIYGMIDGTDNYVEYENMWNFFVVRIRMHTSGHPLDSTQKMWFGLFRFSCKYFPATQHRAHSWNWLISFQFSSYYPEWKWKYNFDFAAILNITSFPLPTTAYRSKTKQCVPMMWRYRDNSNA